MAITKIDTALFEQLAERMPQVIWISDDAGTVVYRNAACREFAGDVGALDAQKVELVDALGGKLIATIATQQTAEDSAQLHESQQAFKLQGEQLASVYEDLQNLAYVVSHELQEPIGQIKSYLNLLSVRYRDRLGPDADEFIRVCVAASRRVERMVDDLWTYARIDKPDANTYVDSGRVLASVLEGFRKKISATNASVTYDENMPTIRSDDKQLSYVFSSLMANALKFKHPDREPIIHIGVQQTGEDWVFSVRDNGIGIDPILRKEIFKLFVRLNDRPDVDGTGMGLAICRRIIAKHGGEIWVESEPGSGTTVYFSFPAKR